MKFCPGLDKEEYQRYYEVIWYDSKNVRITTNPIERIASTKCRKWFGVAKNAPLAEKSSESVVCSACKRLVMIYSMHQHAYPGSKLKHTQPSSNFPLKYLSPNSQKARKMTTQAERSHDKPVLKKYEPQDVILDDSQHDEMYQIMSTLETGGRNELDGVFAEADAHGVGASRHGKVISVTSKSSFDLISLSKVLIVLYTLLCTPACISSLQKPGIEVTGGAQSPYV